MASMLEVLREYKHLTAQKKREGGLPDALESRLAELESLVRAEKERRVAQMTPAPPRNGGPSGALRAPPAADGGRDSKPSDGARRREDPRRARGPSTTRARDPHTGDISGRSEGAPRTSDLPKRSDRAPRERSRDRRKRPSADADDGRVDTATSSAPGLLSDPARRRRVLTAIVVLSALLSPALALLCGLGTDAIFGDLLPGIALFGVVGWALVYPAMMWWRERAARSSTAHLKEPDFVARPPVVEPVLAVLTGLGAVIWLMLGDYADQGLQRTVGYLLGMSFGLAAVAGAAILVVRPFAMLRASERAYDQYLEAGTFNLNKNNARRARRLFERAKEAGKTEAQIAAAATKLEEALRKEASELESRGHVEQAKELRRTAQTSAKPAPTPTPKQVRKAPPSAPAKQATAPRLLHADSLKILRAEDTADDPPGTAPHREAARQLERRGRCREALESLLDAELEIGEALAREAANEYIGAGLLRSADAIYEAIGDRQIPQFYKAVAVEWSRAEEGFDPLAATRLATILWELQEADAAIRVAAQGAMTSAGDVAARTAAAELAERICATIDMAPPPEIVERLGRYAEAADLYIRAGRAAEAERCLREEADRLIESKAEATRALPVLSRLFVADKYLDEKYLGPLVEHLLTTNTGGAVAVRALAAYRQRHREDQRVASRLLELYLEGGKLDEALQELENLESSSGSAPQVVLDGYYTLREKFPHDPRIASGLARALVRSGKAADATGVVRDLLSGPARKTEAAGLVQLIDQLFEWGRSDVELRRERGMLNLERGNSEEALADFERYVTEGGRGPDAIQSAVDILTAVLVTDEGKPNYEAHMRLARFHLFSGTPGAALPLLEVARASDALRSEADLFLGRAELAASNPRRAVQVLRDAIDGRHPQDVPELHFELARAYELLGDLAQAKKIDAALDHFVPGFVQGYLESRPAFDRADTVWMPARPGGTDDLTTTSDTDVGGARLDLSYDGSDEFEDEATRHELDLSDVLTPRYKLLKRVGSGGMGDVHLAEDLALGREVAIKVLRRSLATDLFIAKFKEEARIVAQLSHPGIVGVYDIGQRGEWSYIVMEYVPGPDLATLVHAAIPPTIPELLEVIAQVADAMDYAHRQGVIHRDLKPANILVTRDGTAKVTDFGIARVLQAEGEETAFSAAGLQVGTVNYMAPEQIQGEAVNGQTDIYLLGTTLYYSLSKQYPYVGDAVIVQKLRQDAIPLRDRAPAVSEALEACVARCMARDRKDRFETMQGLARALRALPDIHVGDDETELV